MNRLNPLDNPEISTLPSGMQVATLHLPWSQTVDMSLTIKSGAYDDPPGKEGMAHLLEHLLFSRHKYERIENLGGEVGAFTTNIRISYELKCVAAQFSAIWAPFLLMRANPDFSSENCAHEKVIIDDERDVDRNKQLSLEIIRLSEAIACGYTGFKEPIIGSRESVDAITPADLQIFYNTHSVAANQILVAVGKLTHAEVCDLASEMGDHMPKGPLPQKVRPKYEFRPTAHIFLTEERHQVGIRIVFSAPAKKQDYGAYVAYGLYASMLAEVFRKEFRYNEGSYAHPEAFYNDVPEHGIATLLIRAEIPNSKKEKLQPALDKIISIIQNMPALINEKRLTVRKRGKERVYLQELENIAARRREIERDILHTGKYDSVGAYLAALNSVRLEDIRGIAEKVACQEFGCHLVGGIEKPPLVPKAANLKVTDESARLAFGITRLPRYL